jgi:hypothetical protein
MIVIIPIKNVMMLVLLVMELEQTAVLIVKNVQMDIISFIGKNITVLNQETKIVPVL